MKKVAAMTSEKKKIPFFGGAQAAPTQKLSVLSPFSDKLLPYFPDLKRKLLQGGIQQTPAEFIEATLITSVYLALALTIIAAVLFSLIEMSLLSLIVLAPIFFIAMFLLFLQYPDVRISQRQRDIDMELVFAGRHLLIAMRAGMPFFEALVGVSSGYGVVSEEFRKIVDKVGGGIPLGQALREVGSESPHSSFSSVILQLANALSSGADVASSLESALAQVSKEQVISLKAYGQKLNPMVMFFMVFGIIFPSLGVAFAVILFSLLSGGAISMNSATLLYIFFFIAAVQFFFLTMVESSRPRYIL